MNLSKPFPKLPLACPSSPCLGRTHAHPLLLSVNSWFFVPLLLAGGGLLVQSALCLASCLSWKHSRTLPLWMADVSRRPKPRWCLRSAQPEPFCLSSIFRGFWSNACHHTAMFLPAQEALLQVFLGERAASDLSVLADRLRAGAHPAPPTNNPVCPRALTRVPEQQPAAPGCPPAAGGSRASLTFLPVGLPGPPFSPSAALCQPSTSSSTSRGSGGPAGPHP